MTKSFFCVPSIAVTALILASCTGSQIPTATPGSVAQQREPSRAPRAPATTGYQSLYSFGAGSDGQMPKAALVDVHGALYGTTYGGGEYGDGTVFSISTAGSEKVRHSFSGAQHDGANPAAALVAMQGQLYGTTQYGGRNSFGTVFRMRTNGSEKVLYSFLGVPFAANPAASLINVNGTLYGTTQYGGVNCSPNGCGTVFSITKTGSENVLYKLRGYGYPPNSDGSNPVASLVYVSGALWGTAESGGGFPHGSQGDVGAVFRVNIAGTEKMVYWFDVYPYSSNGCYPQAALTNVNGTMYGTTSFSGMYGGGTVLKYPRSGRAHPVLMHSFGYGSDGSSPIAALLNVKGMLYGTTSKGGAYGGGTLFSINPTTGAETVLHSFGYGSDGAKPLAGLVNVNGSLYGTTSAGGTYGKGTVFALTP